ncbi:hypothetical protein C6P45_000872 [Maudiozyma exigua]|uniref:Ribonuclease H2 subunit B wHTH domain-containing protein n=1 Tax=Maudiozyma exigua TaxID=34358 RepID=A0A9P7B6Y2_MAUEX|nr:hypothetical protein C6P45_000872 [Kazachstania exigua]
MTIALESQEVLLFPKDIDLSQEGKYRIIQLSNPSLIEGKEPIQILIPDETNECIKTYYFDRYVFRSKYLVDASHMSKNKKIDGTKLQEIDRSARSIFIIDEKNREDGIILNQDYLKLLLPYDITYSLISAYIKEMKEPMSRKEADYLKEMNPINESNNKKFLTVRDYRDKLIEMDSIEWNHVPISLISEKLSMISESITECEEQYYKITMEHIIKYLITERVIRIYQTFPKSVPIPSQWPADIQVCMKIVRICQLLISIIPKRVYQSLCEEDTLKLEINNDTASLLTIKQCYMKVKEYKTDTAVSDKEKKLLAETAMQVGLSTSATTSSNNDSNTNGRIVKKSITKRVTTVPKKKKIVQVGKGAIDGFFKRR